jgi:hypothetical protein
MASAASRVPDVRFPSALTSDGGREAGALPRASLASCQVIELRKRRVPIRLF